MLVAALLVALALVLAAVLAARALLGGRAPRARSGRLRVAFLHPDLGVEKLVVEAAVGLQRRGHEVDVYTSFHDARPDRCFPPTADGTLKVVVAGDWLPLHTRGRCQLLKALLRFLWLSVVVLRRHRSIPYDVLIILFYCHFPDLLLTRRESLLKKLYRAPFDWWEQFSTGCADAVLVNSRFTRSVFKRTFTQLSLTPEVLYPAVDLVVGALSPKPSDSLTVLSLNRFERKKKIELALEAFAPLAHERRDVPLRLVVAGGYNPLLQENVDYLKELQERAQRLGIGDCVTFLPSVATTVRDALLQDALVLLYTPPDEHFGIVPLEAALMGTAVIACNSGGPLETIVDGETGYLREPTASAWTAALRELLAQPENAVRMGARGRARVQQHFSATAFVDGLEKTLARLSLGPA